MLWKENHRAELYFMVATRLTALNYLITDTDLQPFATGNGNHSREGDESCVVEAAAHSQVMTVTFEVVPLVHIYPSTLVRHNLTTRSRANSSEGSRIIQPLQLVS